MDTKLLLVQVISLLYRANQSPDKSFDAREYAKHIVEQMKIQDSPLGGEFTHDSLKALKDIVVWMTNVPEEYLFTLDEMKQRVRLAARDEQSLYESLISGITFNMESEQLVLEVAKYRNNIKIAMTTNDFKEKLKQYYHNVSFRPEAIDWRNIAREISNSMDSFDQVFRGEQNEKHRSVVDIIDFNEKDQVHNILDIGTKEIGEGGTICFSHQGVNRMLGDSSGTIGGARRGDTAVCGALQHNFKSGFALNVFKAHAIHNTAYVSKEGAIPTLVRLTFETTARYDVMYLYRNIYENEFNVAVDLKTISVEEATDYIYTKFQEKGWRVILAHVNPTDYTYQDLIDFLDGLRAKGHEIHQLNMDYLNMISKKGLTANTAGEDIRELFRRIRNYGLEHNIFVFTPHQLSMDAKRLIRDGTTDFVKKIANGGYYDGCGRLDQEVDFEIYIHIVKINGQSYLTIGRGKHRTVASLTPDKDLFTCYAFSPIGDVPDDIYGQDMSRKSPGANTAADGGGDAWFEMAT